MINTYFESRNDGSGMRSLDILHGYAIHASDGELGKVVSFLFEEHTWKIRFMVVDAKSQPGGRRLLVPPAVFLAPVREQKRFPLRILKKQIDEYPEVIPDVKTVLYAHRKLIGFTIETADGPAGDVVDFIVDDKKWEIRFLVIDTGTILPGKKVLVSVDKVKKILVDEGRVTTALRGRDISRSPAFDPSEQLNRSYDETIADYYNRSSQWGEDGDHRAELYG